MGERFEAVCMPSTPPQPRKECPEYRAPAFHPSLDDISMQDRVVSGARGMIDVE